MRRGERLSLKARALGWLAQREHSRAELKRKLLRVARAEQAIRAAAAPPSPSGLPEDGKAPRSPPPVAGSPLARDLRTAMDPEPAGEVRSEREGACADPEACVDRLLDWLQARHYLSDTRFVESRVQARSSRYGNLRIRQELAQHGVEPDEQTWAGLRESERERARQVWQRKFGQPPADARERARQMRFLAQRGFSSDAIRAALQAGGDDADED